MQLEHSETWLFLGPRPGSGCAKRTVSLHMESRKIMTPLQLCPHPGAPHRPLLENRLSVQPEAIPT